MATSPLVLEGVERGSRQTPGSEEPCLEVPKVLTLLKGAEVFTVPWERSQGGRRSGPGHQSRGPPSSLCSADRPHPSPPRHGLKRETRLQGVCCLEFKMPQKYVRLSAFPEHTEPRELSEITMERLC